MTNIVNLTPHALKLRLTDGSFMDIAKPAEGTVLPRLAVTKEVVNNIDGLPVYCSKLGTPAGVPDRTADTIYIVSRMVVDACPDREDLFAPGEPIRDAEGKVVGADGISR